VENTQVDVAGIARVVADHAVVPEDGAHVVGVVLAGALGVFAAALVLRHRGHHVAGRRCRHHERHQQHRPPRRGRTAAG
jgi:hypothetical protein